MEDKILDMLSGLCGEEIGRDSLDVNLLDEGLIDSLDYVELLVNIEEAFSVVMSPSEFTREEMDTPRKIMEQVAKRLGR